MHEYMCACDIIQRMGCGASAKRQEKYQLKMFSGHFLKADIDSLKIVLQTRMVVVNKLPWYHLLLFACFHCREKQIDKLLQLTAAYKTEIPNADVEFTFKKTLYSEFTKGYDVLLHDWTSALSDPAPEPEEGFTALELLQVMIHCRKRKGRDASGFRNSVKKIAVFMDQTDLLGSVRSSHRILLTAKTQKSLQHRYHSLPGSCNRNHSIDNNNLLANALTVNE